ncbi:hypothetical protein F4604DRAFT_521545 [Suillus subluteus]|nr:hypothetical protein F4604DRAFT_521545 [Suillus subluteus]
MRSWVGWRWGGGGWEGKRFQSVCVWIWAVMSEFLILIACYDIGILSSSLSVHHLTSLHNFSFLSSHRIHPKSKTNQNTPPTQQLLPRNPPRRFFESSIWLLITSLSRRWKKTLYTLYPTYSMLSRCPICACWKLTSVSEVTEYRVPVNCWRHFWHGQSDPWRDWLATMSDVELAEYVTLIPFLDVVVDPRLFQGCIL